MMNNYSYGDWKVVQNNTIRPLCQSTKFHYIVIVIFTQRWSISALLMIIAKIFNVGCLKVISEPKLKWHHLFNLEQQRQLYRLFTNCFLKWTNKKEFVKKLLSCSNLLGHIFFFYFKLGQKFSIYHLNSNVQTFL